MAFDPEISELEHFISGKIREILIRPYSRQYLPAPEWAKQCGYLPTPT